MCNIVIMCFVLSEILSFFLFWVEFQHFLYPFVSGGGGDGGGVGYCCCCGVYPCRRRRLLLSVYGCCCSGYWILPSHWFNFQWCDSLDTFNPFLSNQKTTPHLSRLVTGSIYRGYINLFSNFAFNNIQQGLQLVCLSPQISNGVVETTSAKTFRFWVYVGEPSSFL